MALAGRFSDCSSARSRRDTDRQDFNRRRCISRHASPYAPSQIRSSNRISIAEKEKVGQGMEQRAGILIMTAGLLVTRRAIAIPPPRAGQSVDSSLAVHSVCQWAVNSGERAGEIGLYGKQPTSMYIIKSSRGERRSYLLFLISTSAQLSNSSNMASISSRRHGTPKTSAPPAAVAAAPLLSRLLLWLLL